MQAYSRGDDGGAPIDEQRVRELIALRGDLRKARNFKGADGVLAQLNAMGISVWDQDRVWKVGNEPPPRSTSPSGVGPDVRVGERIFVTNVAYEVEWQQLRDHFSAYRPVFARVNTNSRTGKPAGNGVAVPAPRLVRGAMPRLSTRCRLRNGGDAGRAQRHRQGQRLSAIRPPPSTIAAATCATTFKFLR